jgi:Ser/Thr protein kinase RdoA (MazF antagonist)
LFAVPPERVRNAFAESLLPPTILGTADPERAWHAVAEWVREHLQSEPVECFHCGASVGLVFGIRLADSRSVAVKAHPPDVEEATLRSFSSAQRSLTAAGFPAPRPLGGPGRLLNTLAVAEAWLPGSPGDFDDPAVVAASAAAFAHHTRLLRRVRFEALPRTIAGEPWPPRPHNALFDFSLDVEGARWIDDVAIAARPHLERGEVVAAHGDWSGKHVRFVDATVAAVYDWDSLRLDREPVLAGFAAACHWVMLDPSRPWRAEPRRVRAFLDAYDASRGRPMSPPERDAALAAAVYLFAYTARCEHGFIGAGVPVTAIRETLVPAVNDLLSRG